VAERFSTMDTLADVKARVRALRQRTTAHGCTEAEAMAAAAKVREIMERHGLSDELVTLPPFSKAPVAVVASQRRPPWPLLRGVVAVCCGVAAWTEEGYSSLDLTFFGFEPDVILADYLHEVLCGHAYEARREFLRSAEYRRRRTRKTKSQAATAFLHGFVRRLVDRLLELFEYERRKPALARKRQLIDAEMQRLAIQLAERRTFRTKTPLNHPAFAQGSTAGRAVGIHLGVERGAGEDPRLSRPTLQLGGPRRG